MGPIGSTGPTGPTGSTGPTVGGSSARAHCATAQSIPGSTWTKINIDTSDIDPGSNLDVATNHRYNVPVTGLYLVSVSAAVSFSSANQGIYAAVAKNGALSGYAGAVGTGYIVASHADIVSCTAGDHIEVWCFVSTGMNLSLDGINVNALAVARLT
jgi:hypothetical protein